MSGVRDPPPFLLSCLKFSFLPPLAQTARVRVHGRETAGSVSCECAFWSPAGTIEFRENWNNQKTVVHGSCLCGDGGVFKPLRRWTVILALQVIVGSEHSII